MSIRELADKTWINETSAQTGVWNSMKQLDKGVFENIIRKIAHTATKLNDKFPHITENGHWQTTQAGYWTGGFWVGLLWRSYTLTEDKKFMQWAYDETGDEKYYRVVYNHPKQTVKEFVRKDCSTIHVIYFDLDDGRIIKKTTYQGYSSDSCWSRGQAWAIYGFALAYKTSKDKIFLDAAEKLADYFIENLPADYVPYWDFGDPEIPNSVKDSSAAAIACSGLLTLSELSEKKEFKESVLKIMNSLSKNYLAEKPDGILNHGCFHKPKNLGVNESLIWGAYYFVEALCKLFIIGNTS